MMKLTLKLLIVIAIVVALAGLCGGWKWDGKPSKRRAVDYALLADPNSPINASTNPSPTPGAIDPTANAANSPTDPSTLAPTDSDVSSTPGDILTTDGWTWD